MLKPWHTGFFGLGFVADTTGTLLMTQLADSRRDEGRMAMVPLRAIRVLSPPEAMPSHSLPTSPVLPWTWPDPDPSRYVRRMMQVRRNPTARRA